MITLSPSTSMFISVPSYHPNSDTTHSGTSEPPRRGALANHEPMGVLFTHPGQQSGDPGGRRQHGGGRWRPYHPPRHDPRNSRGSAYPCDRHRWRCHPWQHTNPWRYRANPDPNDRRNWFCSAANDGGGWWRTSSR